MILILGGTTEGRLAANTLDESGSPFYYSTRGDEQEVSLHHGIRLQGGMDAEAMELFCRQKEIRLRASLASSLNLRHLEILMQSLLSHIWFSELQS